MTTETPDRIIELWPHLSEAGRADLITRAEAIAASPDTFEFTAEDLARIERGRKYFKSGQAVSLPEYRADMDAFFDRLKADANARS